jgi:hypothetical protein
LVTIDGYKFVMDDGGWLLMRFSGTEPLLRVYTETTDSGRRGRHPGGRARPGWRLTAHTTAHIHRSGEMHRRLSAAFILKIDEIGADRQNWYTDLNRFLCGWACMCNLTYFQHRSHVIK